MENDGQNASEFLFTPTVRKDISGMFLKQPGETDPEALHIVIRDQVGFHPREGEQHVPDNVKLLPLPPYSPELNPVEGLGERIKDAICNWLRETLGQLEEAILEELAVVRQGGAAVAGMIHGWIRAEANASDPI